MTDPLSLIQDQLTDYRQLLTATESLLGDAVSEQQVSDYLSLRHDLLARTTARESALISALADIPQPLRATYQQLLEQVIDADTRLTESASAQRQQLQEQLGQLGIGYRALSGYRQPDRGDVARAISRRA